MLSLSLEEVSAYKLEVTRGAEFAERVSLGMAFQLDILESAYGETHNVLFEIDHLERDLRTSTKPAEQFKYAPLFPFWHKHFATNRHFMRNIGERWGIARGSGNNDLTQLIERAHNKYGHDLDLLSKYLSYYFLYDGLKSRGSAGKLTGDWIIYGKHDQKNFYLALATHEQAEAGEPAMQLMEKLRLGSRAEFPFLF